MLEQHAIFDSELIQRYDTVGARYTSFLHHISFNRLSLGIQDFNPPLSNKPSTGSKVKKKPLL